MTQAWLSDSGAPHGRSRRRTTRTYASAAVSLVLVAAAVGFAGTRRVFELLREVDTRWLGAAFLVGVGQLALLGLRWSRVARALGAELGWLRATTEYALSLLGNQLLPMGFAGDGLRGVREAQRSDRGWWSTFEAIALDRASGQLALWLCVLFTAPLSVQAGILPGSTLAAVVAALALALALAAWLLFRVRSLDRPLAPVRSFVRRAAELLLSRRALVHLPLSLALVCCSTLQLYIAARALHIELPWLELAWLGPLVLVAASVPSFFGGWGVREGAAALSFAAAGMPDSAGVAVSVVYGVFALVISLPAVVVLFFDSGATPSGDQSWTYANALSMIVGSLLAAWAFYPPLLGFVAGFCTFVLVAQSKGRWTPKGRFGVPNLITTARLLMTVALLFAYGRQPGWHLAAAAGTILLMDVADGWIARKTGQSSEFGASYDVEADALLVMSVTLLLFVRGIAGGWVLVAGLLRYAYVLAPALVPTPLGPAPRSVHGRLFYVCMLVCFMLALVLDGERGRLPALIGTGAISVSFAHSFWQRYRGSRSVGAQ